MIKLASSSLVAVALGLGLTLAAGSAFAQKDPPPKKEGCSPGFYKNHLDLWTGDEECCTSESDPTCGEILDALSCKGSDASCGRSAAAAILDACTGCTE